jgi:tyrosyl-DNA phosphodiesterase-1
MFSGSAFKTETAPLFHDANSRRGGVLMHTKMIIALFEQKPNSLVASSSSTASPSSKRKADEEEAGADGVGGWVYVGSHNFSSAAWGTLNFTKRPPTLHVSVLLCSRLTPDPQLRAWPRPPPPCVCAVCSTDLQHAPTPMPLPLTLPHTSARRVRTARTTSPG